jgi:hypothetical protein
MRPSQALAVMSRSVSRAIVVYNIRERVESRPRDVVDTMDDHEYHSQREESKPEHKVIEERVIYFARYVREFHITGRMEYLKYEVR